MATSANEFLPELGDRETEFAAEALHEVPAALAEAAARAALDAVSGEFEGEGELNPVRRWYTDAVFEHLAHAAAEAETEDEAGEAFFPLIPLIAAKLLPLAAKAAPLIAKAMPKVLNVVSRVTPQLTRGVSNIARTMFRQAGGRRLMRTLPTIAQRAVGQIARQVAAGQPITARGAVQALARQAANVLRQPARVRTAVARSGAFDRQLHQTIRGSVATAAQPDAPAGPSAAPAGAPRCGAPAARACGCVCGGCGCR